MQLYLENCDSLTESMNSFSAKEDLIEVLESAQSTDHTLTPIEVAALHLTMRQIDEAAELPSTEDYELSPILYADLAIESLKENIQGKWEAFVKGVRIILKKIKTFILESAKRVKAKFKSKKAGDQNKHFKREGEGEGEQTEQEEAKVERDTPKPEVNTYTLDRAWIDMGDQANANTLLERLNYLPKLMHIVDYATSRAGQINGEVLKFSAEQGQAETLQRVLQRCGQEILDNLVDNGASTEWMPKCILKISDTVNITMMLHDYASFPEIIIEEGNEVQLELPEDRNNYADKLSKASEAIVTRALDFYKQSAKLVDDEIDLAKVTDPESRKIVMKLSKLYSARLKITTQLAKMINASTDIADGIAADIRG